MKKFIPSVLVVMAISGCGGSSGSSSNLIEKSMKVVEGSYVVNANVCDISNNCYKSNSAGVVNGKFDKNSSLISKGGFIDLNLNGKFDENDIKADNMKAPYNAQIISPITTIIANGANINELSSITGYNANDLLNKDPIQSKDAKLLKIIYALSLILKENKVNEFVDVLNNKKYISQLPTFDGNNKYDVFYITNYVLDNYENEQKLLQISALENNYDLVMNGIKNLENDNKLNENNQNNIDKNGLTNINGVNSKDTQVNVSTNLGEKNTNNTQTTINQNSIANTVSSNSLPNFNNISSTSNKNSNYNIDQQSDLPNLELINTSNKPSQQETESNTYLPSFSKDVEYVPVPDNNSNYEIPPVKFEYYIKLNKFNLFVKVNKISDTEYQFNSPIVVLKESNLYDDFDINATYVFDNVSFSSDGQLIGNLKVSIKDENSSEMFTWNASNVKYTIVDSKLITTDLSNINLSTPNGSSLNLNAGVYSKYNVDLSKIMIDANDTKLKQPNHLYSFVIEYDIGDKALKLKGKYNVIDAHVPNVSLNTNRLILPMDEDVYTLIGTTDSNNAICNIEGIDFLKCEIKDNNIYIKGKTPDQELFKDIFISVSDKNYLSFTSKKQLYIEVLKPADNVVVTNWDLSAGAYEGHKIYMELKGNMSNNIISVKTSAPLVQGTLTQPIVAYLLEDNNNYIVFKFDKNAYKPTDWFIIERKDGKKVEFSVSDIKPDNNGFVFK